MDGEVAIWLGELIGQAVLEIAQNPGLTIEVDGHPQLWLQVIPVPADEGTLSSFLLNFPYRDHAGNPAELLASVGVQPPPDTTSPGWEPGGSARLVVRKDVPLVALAHFCGDVLQHIVGAPPDASYAVQFEYGY